jgi:hypothetical protein
MANVLERTLGGAKARYHAVRLHDAGADGDDLRHQADSGKEAVGGKTAISIVMVNATTITATTAAMGMASVLTKTPSDSEAGNTLFTYVMNALMGEEPSRRDDGRRHRQRGDMTRFMLKPTSGDDSRTTSVTISDTEQTRARR